MSKELREVAIYYKNIGPEKANQVHCVNMAAHLTDQDIHTYFKPGLLVNLGCGPFDLMAEVEKVEIIK
jgi:hypothetical protein